MCEECDRVSEDKGIEEPFKDKETYRRLHGINPNETIIFLAPNLFEAVLDTYTGYTVLKKRKKRIVLIKLDSQLYAPTDYVKLKESENGEH